MKNNWTMEKIIKEIRRVMDDMGVDYMPPAHELAERAGIYSTTLKPYGGMRNIASMMGIKLAPKIRKSANLEKMSDVRPSKAEKIEAEARKQGLRYADIQKAETLRMVGGVHE